MIVLKVEKIGEGRIVALGAEALEVLGGADTEFVGLLRNDRGEVTIRSVSASFVEQLERGQEFMARYDETFQALAKS